MNQQVGPTPLKAIGIEVKIAALIKNAVDEGARWDDVLTAIEKVAVDARKHLAIA